MIGSHGDVDLVGLRLLGPGPLGGAYLRLAEGVTVLYGKNGAGKTSALTAIRAALTGIRGEGEAWLYVRVTEPEAPLSAAGDPLVHAIAQALTPKGTFTRSTDSIADLVQDAVEANRHLTVDFELLREIALQGYFALAPVGASTSQWQLWLAAADDEASPHLRQQMTSLRELWERARGEEDITDLELLVMNHPLGASFESPDFLPDDHAFGPPWAPLPLNAVDPLVTLDQAIAFVFDDESLTDPEIGTMELLRSDSEHQPRPILESGSDQVTADVEALRVEVSKLATVIFSEVLLDAPRLRCEISPPDSWFDGHALRWVAYDLPTGEWVLLPVLSRAQRRWAQVAIAAALIKHQPRPTRSVMLLDEPELALHSLAEQYMANALPALASRMGTQLIVASHSADLLNQRANRLVHVRRGTYGITEMAVLASDIASLALDKLGIKPSDLLQLRRVFLLVEGEHDRAILQALLGDRFQEFGVDLLPFRGGTQLAHVVDSQFLFLFTDARVIVVLDNLRAEVIRQLWAEVQERLAAGDRNGARRLLQTRLGREGEEGFLQEFGIRAVEEERVDRVDVFGFSKRDIICYLPVQTIVPEASSWEELEARYNREYPPGSEQRPGYRSFKNWLRITYGARISVPIIERAVVSLDALPDEFADLLKLCQHSTPG